MQEKNAEIKDLRSVDCRRTIRKNLMDKGEFSRDKLQWIEFHGMNSKELDDSYNYSPQKVFVPEKYNNKI